MRKRVVSGIMLTLLFIGMLLLAFNIQPAKAAVGKLYIKPDGTIDPPYVGLDRDGDLYYFYTHIFDYEIIVQRSNIVIDGNGYLLDGPGEGTDYYGVWVESSNVNITNTHIRGWWTGIWVNPNGLYSSSDNNVSSNTITDVTWGVNLDRSSDNTIYGNTIKASAIGIIIDSGAYVPPVIPSCYNDIYGNNITSSTGGGWGIYVDDYSDSNVISGNNVSDNYCGITLDSCSDNTVSDNILWYNSPYYGVELWNASYNIISGNSIQYNGGGIGLWESSHHNTIFGHNEPPKWIAGNEAGVVLGEGAYNNTIFENLLLVNYPSIYLRNASNNKFYHNRFLGGQYVYDESWDNPEIPPSVNTWDDGYPSGGNHWSIHTKVDEYQGPDQDQLGGDGISDTPYVIDVNNEDRYPLTLESAYDVTIKAVSDLSPASVNITKDGLPTGYTTPHYFWDLIGTHWFTVPDRDPHGYPFKEWNTGETNTTIKVTSAGTYTAYYEFEIGVIDVAFGSTPTVDGSISTGEYIDANSVTFATSGGTCTVYFKHDGTTLYVAFDVPNVDADSAVQIFVDTEYDQANAPQTDDYQFTIRIDGGIGENQGTGADWGPWGPPEDWTGAHQVFASTWNAEFAISYQKLGITAGVAKTIGISFWNAWTSTEDHRWPTGAGWLDPSTWGTAPSSNNWMAPTAREWTFMVYLDADNNLEDAGIDDFLEMAAIGSTPDVNIVVQMDRIDGYNSSYDDWVNCRRYLVTYGMTPTTANALQTLGEVNMGDLNTLANFMAWGIQNYPADHYVVVLWDHGSGWKDRRARAWNLTFEEIKWVCLDETDDWDSLTTIELKQALATVENTTGVKVDIVGFDACLMGMIEIAYQIKDYADIMVASEETEPLDGWPYNDILSALTSYPAMTSSALATEIVMDYIASYTDELVTQSAVNLTIDDLVTATSNFAQELIDGLPDYQNNVTQASQQVEYYHNPTYVDLYHFAQLIHTLIPDQDIQTSAEQVMNVLTDTIIAEGHLSGHPNSHGLSIYFPSELEHYDSSYENLAFTTHTKWDEFLNQYYGIYAETPVQIDGETYIITTRSNVTLTDVTASRTTLKFTTSGDPGETGYVNTTMPVGLNQTEIEVFIDEVKITPPPFPIITTNGTHYFIYFEFTLSTHDITIQYAIADIAVTNITSSKTVIGQGYSMNLTVTIENLGSYAETFNVTTYYNSNVINYTTVPNLPPGEETTITLTWNTTGVPYGNYTVSANATIVPGETETTDNTKTDGWVKVTVVGDVNGDCLVTGLDVLIVTKIANFMKAVPEAEDPNADVNGDGIVTGLDVLIITSKENFMKGCPL